MSRPHRDRVGDILEAIADIRADTDGIDLTRDADTGRDFEL